MRLLSEQLFQFAVRRLSRALARTGVRVSNLAYRYLADVVCLPVHNLAPCMVAQKAIIWSFQQGMTYSRNHPERVFLFKQAGDWGLLVCGFFWRQHDCAHRPVDVAYCARVGREAYEQIGGDPYQELADKYPKLVDVMAFLATNYTNRRDENIMALYEAWARDRNVWAARILARMGIAVGVQESRVPS